MRQAPSSKQAVRDRLVVCGLFALLDRRLVAGE
jgi:hypothetical protein